MYAHVPYVYVDICCPAGELPKWCGSRPQYSFNLLTISNRIDLRTEIAKESLFTFTVHIESAPLTLDEEYKDTSGWSYFEAVEVLA